MRDYDDELEEYGDADDRREVEADKQVSEYLEGQR